MTVYVVNMVDDDISSAQQHGDIVHINHRYIYGDQIENERMPGRFEEHMCRCVDDFSPDTDYLLIVGDHLQLVAMAAMLGRRYGKFRVLRWDKKAEGYLAVWVIVPGAV